MAKRLRLGTAGPSSSGEETFAENRSEQSVNENYHHGSQHTLSDLQKEMQATQKNAYTNFMLPGHLWLRKKCLLLEELYVKRTMLRRSDVGKKEALEIGIEEIFDEIESKIPRRILIESQQGYGKTTLVMKLLSDWSKGEKYISDRFDLVFVIPMRYFKGNLSSLLLQQCDRVEGSEDMKLNAINAVEERVLLLLDGLDEIPSGDKEKLYRLFKGDDYPQMTVVVTSRTGFLLTETSSCNAFDAFIWDKRVDIQGILYEERIHFIQKYLNIDYKELKEKTDGTNVVWNELFECPLFLLLSTVLIQENDIRQIKTKTELYKTIFNFVINRGLEKLKGERKDINVFDLQTQVDEFGCGNLLINFGRLCLEKIKERSLIFEESELLKCSGDGNGDQDLILKLGFLSKQISFFGHEEKEHYEPIHRSFLEFSAAIFLSSFDEMEREIQELVSKFDICPNKDQFLYPFVGGLLQCNAFKLLKALSPYEYLNSVFSSDYDVLHNVENVLLEIPETDEILKSLETLSIGYWRNFSRKNFSTNSVKK